MLFKNIELLKLSLHRNGLFKLHQLMWNKHVFKCTSELNTSVVVSTAGLVLLWAGLDAILFHEPLCALLSPFLHVQRLLCTELKPTFPGRSETSCCGFLQSLGQRCLCAVCGVSDRREGNPVKSTGWYFRLSLGHRVLIKVLPRKSTSSHCWGNTQHCDFNLFVLDCVYNAMVSTLCLKPLPLTCRIIFDVRKRL